MDDLIQRIYQKFSQSPLKADEQHLYVDLDDVRGDADVVRLVARRIRLREQATAQVLAGHRGSGKSTELIRLASELQNGEPRFFVVQCTASDIDLHDVDFPDILVEIIRQLAQQLAQREQIRLKPGYFKDRWERLKKLLFSEVSVDSLELDVGMATIATTIKGSPDARKAIRELLEPDTGNWLVAANDVIGEAELELQKRGYAGLVVIVDNLDHMDVRPHDTAKCPTDEYLFVNRAAQLTGFRCHLVYAMPISLAYSHNAATIASSYGGDVPVVPMTKIRTPPPNSRPYNKGMEKFRDVIDRRLADCGVKVEDVFKPAKVRDDLIKLSGGDPSSLMRLVREAIISDDLPIITKSLHRVTTNGRRMYDRQLRQDHWPILCEVRDTGGFVRTKENEESFREMLDSRAILQYVNDDVWYGLNPMVQLLDPPEPKSEPS